MSTDHLSAHLLRLEIFQDLTPLHLTEIVRRAERVIYRPGQALITDGEVGDAAVIPLSGDVVRTAGPALHDEEPVEHGSLLGEMAMLIDTEYSSTVVARTPVKALRIARHDMVELMTDDPALAEHFVQKVSGRLHRIAAELRDIEESLSVSIDADCEPADAAADEDSFDVAGGPHAPREHAVSLPQLPYAPAVTAG